MQVDVTAVLTTILVDTFDDVTASSDGRISLREALVQAVGTPAEDDTIILPAGDYVLTDGQVAIHDPTGRLTLRSEGGTAVIDAAAQESGVPGIFGQSRRATGPHDHGG